MQEKKSWPALRRLLLALPPVAALSLLIAPLSKATPAWDDFNINDGTGIGDSSALTEEFNNIIMIIYGIGGGWVLLWIIIGILMLSGSGSSPQRRNGAIVCLGMAAIGGFLLANAHDLAGWIIST